MTYAFDRSHCIGPCFLTKNLIAAKDARFLIELFGSTDFSMLSLLQLYSVVAQFFSTQFACTVLITLVEPNIQFEDKQNH